MICVVAFAIAIPLLAALVLVNRLETFRHRRTSSRTVAVAKATAQGSAFAGLVGGFWHIHWALPASTSFVLALGALRALHVDPAPDPAWTGTYPGQASTKRVARPEGR
jgi:hypothetical protein